MIGAATTTCDFRSYLIPKFISLKRLSGGRFIFEMVAGVLALAGILTTQLTTTAIAQFCLGFAMVSLVICDTYSKRTAAYRQGRGEASVRLRAI